MGTSCSCCTATYVTYVFGTIHLVDFAMIIWQGCSISSPSSAIHALGIIAILNLVVQHLVSGAGKTHGVTKSMHGCVGKNIETAHSQDIREKGESHPAIVRFILRENHSAGENAQMFCYYYDMVFSWRAIAGWFPMMLHNIVSVAYDYAPATMGAMCMTLIYKISMYVYKRNLTAQIAHMQNVNQTTSALSKIGTALSSFV